MSVQSAKLNSYSSISVLTTRVEIVVANIKESFGSKKVVVESSVNPKNEGKYSFINIKSNETAVEHDNIVRQCLHKYNIVADYKLTAVVNLEKFVAKKNAEAETKKIAETNAKKLSESSVAQPKKVTSISSISIISNRQEITVQNIREAYGSNEIVVDCVANPKDTKFVYCNIKSHLAHDEHDRIMRSAIEKYNINTRYEKTAKVNFDNYKAKGSSPVSSNKSVKSKSANNKLSAKDASSDDSDDDDEVQKLIDGMLGIEH